MNRAQLIVLTALFSCCLSIAGLFVSFVAWRAVSRMPENIEAIRPLAPDIEIQGLESLQTEQEIREFATSRITAQTKEAESLHSLLSFLGTSINQAALWLMGMFGALAVLLSVTVTAAFKHLRSNQPLHPDALTRAGERRR